MSDLLAKLAKYGVPAELLCQVAALVHDAECHRKHKAYEASKKRRQRVCKTTRISDLSRDIPGTSPGHPRDICEKPNEINGELFSEFASEKERKEEKGLPHTPSKEKKRKKEDISLIFGFEGFWGAYPRRVAKLAAIKAYKKALANGAEPSALEAGARRYGEAVKGREVEFVSHPATWLNAGRWMDGQDLSEGEINARRLREEAIVIGERYRREREQHRADLEKKLLESSDGLCPANETNGAAHHYPRQRSVG